MFLAQWFTPSSLPVTRHPPTRQEMEISPSVCENGRRLQSAVEEERAEIGEVPRMRLTVIDLRLRQPRFHASLSGGVDVERSQRDGRGSLTQRRSRGRGSGRWTRSRPPLSTRLRSTGRSDGHVRVSQNRRKLRMDGGRA